MNRICRCALWCVGFFVLFLSPPAGLACDRADLTLDSLIVAGGTYQIHATFCLGGGVRGSSAGAGGNTSYLVFAFFTPGNVPISITSFAPDSLVSDTTNCPLFGFDLLNTPGIPSIPSDGAIGYFDLYNCFPNFMCTNTQALCGDMHTQCWQVAFTTDILPDSIRLLGAEEASNGWHCFPNPDMLLDFSTTLPLAPHNLQARQEGTANLLTWRSAADPYTDYFEVQRRDSTAPFSSIAQIPQQGDTYNFRDPAPLPGVNLYRIRQVDRSGQSTFSETVRTNFQPPAQLKITGIFPNPTSGICHLQCYSPEMQPLRLTIFDPMGLQISQTSVATRTGNNSLPLDLSHLPRGMYFLRLENDTQALQQKICLQ